MKKVWQFCETNQDLYDAHVSDYLTLKHGGKVDIFEVKTELGSQTKIYHNPELSDIGQHPQWLLVALVLIPNDPSHSQFFILKEVDF